jgi:uncharacterized protein YdeI (YjbR/CyaY-like superfamily)
MEMKKTLHVTGREEWRAWLEANGRSESEVWLVFYKAHTGAPALPYEESIEEALCFGWVDSLIQRIDDDRYARKFTPRKPGSPWSESNKRRMARMVQAGRMTAAGLALYPFPIPREDPGPPPKRQFPPFSPELEEILRANPLAWENYHKLPPSHQRMYRGWIMDAKKEETRRRRLEQAIPDLEQGKSLGQK